MTLTMSPTFVLVPGAWQGGWAWQPVARRLREAGYAAVTVTLPGLADGDDRAGLRLPDAIGHVVAEVERRGLAEVVLVGQSWGGYVITGAANALTGRLAKVIYYNAVVPARGTAMVDENAGYAALTRAAIAASPDGTIGLVREQVPMLMPEADEQARDLFFELLLYWTSRGRAVPERLVPVLAGWADLDQREDAADIGPGHPILIDPEYQLDPLLAPFLGRSRFAWLAEGTRQAYAKDYRLFISFLWQRGKYWHGAAPDDLLDWEAWRRRGQQPGRRISGSKWQRELAALRLLYEWAEKEDHIARSPVLVHAVRLREGGTVMAADQAPRNVRCSDVKWVTPRTYRLWRDTGLLGYNVSGQPDPSWRRPQAAKNKKTAKSDAPDTQRTYTPATCPRVHARYMLPASIGGVPPGRRYSRCPAPWMAVK